MIHKKASTPVTFADEARAAEILGRVRRMEVRTNRLVDDSMAGRYASVFKGRVQALGAAMLVPASMALVVQAFPAERRTHAIGLWGAAAALAAGLGPPIGGFLVELGGWRWAFLVNLPFGLLAIWAARSRLVESRAPGRRTLPDLAGALVFALALGLLTLGLVQGNDWGWSSWRIVGCFLASAALLIGFVFSSRRHRSPLLDPALLKIRSFAVGSLGTLVAGMGFYAYLLTNILWLTFVWRYSIVAAGLALVPGALVAMLVAAVFGPMAARRGYLPFVLPGALIWATAFVWYATQTGLTPAFLTEWLPGQLLSGVGVGLTLPLLGSAALAAVPGGRYATASAAVSSARQIGGVIGIAVLVVIIGTPTGATAADDLRTGWWLSVGCFVVCALIVPFLGRIRPVSEDPLEAGSQRVDVHLPSGAQSRQSSGSVDDSTLFRRLPPDVRTALESGAEERHLNAGDWLFHEGDPADDVYVVRTGRLDVVVGETVVRQLGPGSVVGELALLAAENRSASVRAHRDSAVLKISRVGFESAMAGNADAFHMLATVLAEQLRHAQPSRELGRGQPTTVAVLGLHQGAASGAVGAALLHQLRRSLRADVLADPTPPSLEQAERSLDRVLLVADWGDAQWDFCIRQADQVVLVADAGFDPGANVLERARGTEADLVLVGPGVRPDDVGRWCAAIDPWQVTMVAGDLQVGLRALAARIAGRSIGVVMAGGGARAFAHIGVLRELEDSGIVVDRTAGCSLGAIVAAAWSLGLDGEAVHDVCYAEFVRRQPFSDYTLPTVSLAKGQRTALALRRHFGGHQIQSLPRQFRCNSVDLVSRERVAHRSGDLADAVTASASLPVLFPPRRTEDQLLVDGGVLDNLPVTLLTERSEGPNLAVNITMGGGGGGPRRSGPPRVPALGDTMLRTMMIGSRGAVQAARDAGATVITPPPLGVGLLEFHQLDLMVEAGRIAVRELLVQSGGTFGGV